MEKLDGKSLDLTAENVEKIKAIFPSVVAEGKVDADKLLTLLGEAVDDGKEKYAFTWKGKMDAIRIAQTRSAGTLRPCKEESVNWDTTQNLYIEGDNLEVLKLLAASYHGAIKMIYIDPPYNTGKDFVYKDSFGDSIENYKQITGQAQTSNAETAGRYHTNWLNMMYPRLKLAHVLLSEDGVIFISIDDNEVGNLRKICDEIFGEDAFLGQITVVGNPRGRDYGGIARMHDYILVYKKSDDCEINLIPDTDGKGFTQFDDIGGYELRELRNRNIKFNKENRPNLYYPFYINPNSKDSNSLYEISLEKHNGWIELYPLASQGINTVWRWGKPKSQENLNIHIKAKRMMNGGYQIVEKYRESNVMARSVWWDKDTNTEKGTLLVKDLFDAKVFDYPKPIELIMRCMQMGTSGNDEEIILDFFSGSGTTAHAAMQLNAQDNGNRKVICIQLPEPTTNDSEAFKAEYKTLCEIGKERIRRAGAKIAEENRMTAPDLDIGFKVFKLDSTNLIVWDNSYTDDEEEVAKRAKQQSLFYLKDDRTDLDLVVEIMLKNGRQLTDKITEVEVKGIKVYIIENPEYKILVCLQPNINLDAVEAMISDLPPIGTFIFADRCFKDVNEVLNTREILRKNSRNFRLF